MNKFSFKILKKSKRSKARLGILKTPHGDVLTPAFVTVGTKGTVKSLTPHDLNEIGTQIVFVNTYHAVLSPGVEVIEKAGGIHQFSKIDKPIITDSGGFQVFSLRNQKSKFKSQNDNAKLKIDKRKALPIHEEEEAILVKISDNGVMFRSLHDGSLVEFTPEKSIEYQRKIGADLMVAFDECTYYGASYEYTKKAMERTHEWARRSLAQMSNVKAQMSKLEKGQKIYGVIQGGLFKDLRQESAKVISSLPFFGLAIGGVSVGETEKEMRDQVSWVMEVIRDDKRPRHLLGVGEIDDIFDVVKMGIDTMDCVIPTRHARMGKLYQYQKLNIKYQNDISNIKNIKEIDIFKSQYKEDLNPIQDGCQCYACQNFSRAYLHHLFKQRELLGYRLATIHNLFFIEKLFEGVRKKIEEDRL